MAPLIALTTDFGAGSLYVAQLKGVLLSALPGVTLVDVSHDIPPQSLRHAEAMLRSTAFSMPLGTVHVVVIDPGVGTNRRGIAVQARGTTFVGPDNGVLGVAIGQPDARVVVLDKPWLFRSPVSSTFHGRDIFAPVAAELAGGLHLEGVGSPIDDPIPSMLPAPATEDSAVRGETLVADSFGNLTTNIPSQLLASGWRARVGDADLPTVETYGQAAAGDLIALVGSDGFIEIAVRGGSAAERLGAEAGLEVVCTPSRA